MKKIFNPSLAHILGVFLFTALCKLALAEELKKTDNDTFINNLQSIISSARKLNHAEFISLASKQGIVASRYYSADTQNISFANRFTPNKIPKTLDFSTGIKGAGKLTIPGMLDALKDTGVVLDPSKCKLDSVNVQAMNLDAVLDNKSANSKAAQIAKLFYQVFSLDRHAKHDIAQVCLTNKEHSQAYFGLISTPEDGSNELIFGAALFFEKENKQWRLRGLAEFL